MVDFDPNVWTNQDYLGFFALLIAGGLAILQYVVQPYLFKPKLRIEFDPTRLHEYLEDVDIVDLNNTSVRLPHRYFYLKVRNISKFFPAHTCKAELQIINSTTKKLVWDDGTLDKDIGANGAVERFHVVYSTSFFNHNKQDATHALISTQPSLYSPIRLIRGQDGLGVGDHRATITVRSKEGAKDTARFIIHVTSDHSQLSIEKCND